VIEDQSSLGGLHHSSDDRPGINRRRAGRGFAYRDADGQPVRDRETLARIRSIVIPPAWTDVWICPSPYGHLQATGRDARGRKQYRYHPRYRARREGAKFESLIAFAKALPAIRDQVERDLARPGLPREKVVAAVVRLLELTLIRVGNDEYARLNRSFGLTTLRNRHANVEGIAITFRFRGKSGQQHEVGLRDRRLASVVKRCRDLPGQELFQYVDDDGEPQDIASDDVNAYLAAVAPGITAKDFRTWAGTVLAFRALRAIGKGSTEREKQRNIAAAIQATAEGLGNTPAVARSAYVHPAVVDAYLDGRIRAALVEAAEETDEPPGSTDPDEERAVVALLRARLREDAARSASRRASRGRSTGRSRSPRKARARA
jgi:DNA topoisomerase-1